MGPPRQERDRLSTLPTALLLRVLSHLSLPDLVLGVKPISRTLYLHAVNLARQQALPLWLEEVQQSAMTRTRAGGGGAPLARSALTGIPALVLQTPAVQHEQDGDFPPPSYAQAEQSAPTKSPLSSSTSRELAIFDLFTATLAVSLSRLAASTLLMTGEDDALRIPKDARQDLFSHLQPKARCEDLVIAEGIRRGWIVGGVHDSAVGRFTTIGAEDIRVDPKLREARLLLPFRSGSDDRSRLARTWRSVVSVARDSGDDLETVARRLVRQGDHAGVVRVEEADGRRRYEL
ncbi:hypothetical protein JCM8115_001314 [Rhodotorula mucilaginosa]|jgi:hypothetical protein|uniref:F-box domain-containing protein n=1 Tax=Rhodotorula mucilaginosa TaxID=5537 RepID=A0A9P6W2Q9_RHOMI|nr:hypothetical protein C6P46_003500 [Rhodotorula mucilaginosa]